MRRLNGLGVANNPDGTLPPTTPTPGTPVKPSITDTISKWLGIGQQAAGIYTTYKNGVGAGSNVNTMNYTPPAAQTDNTMKYVKIGGVVVGAGLLTWGLVSVLSSSKKKKS